MNKKEEKNTLLNNRVEGEEAVKALFDSLEKENLLVDSPKSAQEKILERLDNLEKEVAFLKVLFSKSVETNKVLKD